jgi:glycosyltransferase involved in cell wall biosynthesis
MVDLAFAATGPSHHWVRVMRGEYEKAGLTIERATVYDRAFWRREEEEYALADRHCAASTVVRDQLIGFGIRPDRIWVVPDGAAPDVFFPAPDGGSPGKFRILFAGQLSLRKDLAALLQALEKVGRPDWGLDVFGSAGHEAWTGPARNVCRLSEAALGSSITSIPAASS